VKGYGVVVARPRGVEPGASFDKRLVSEHGNCLGFAVPDAFRRVGVAGSTVGRSDQGGAEPP
jgi:hypothetical protein